MKNTIIILIIAMILTGLFTIFFPIKTCVASGNTLNVGSGQAYSTIQAAINDANESDTVYVYSGTYNENIVIDKSITLTGAGKSITTISGSGEYTIKITANNVAISGFKIQNKVKGNGNGVYLISSNSNTITDNTIEGNNVGIYFSNSDSNIIHDNTIQNNNANGVYLTSTSSSNTFYKNYFLDNTNYNAVDYNSNTWSYNSEGNYWDDYDDYDSNNDGIGDSPYIIDSNSQDNYPIGKFLNMRPGAIITSITPNPATAGQTVSFYGDWSDDSGTPLQWEWKSSKNGVFGHSKNCQSSSLSIGTHTISFRVYDGDVWSDYNYSTLIIRAESSQNQLPIATIEEPNPSKTTYIYGETVEFRGNGQDYDGFINGWSWHSEPTGITSNQEDFTRNNIPVGEYTIYFKVKDNNEDWSSEKSISIEIVVDPFSENQPPVANAGGPYTGHINETIFFDGSDSYDPENDTLEYIWIFGDGSNATGQKVEHNYSFEGQYNVTLIVTDKTHGSQAFETTYIIISAESNNNGNGGNNGDNQGNSEKDEQGVPLVVIIIGVTLAIFVLIILIFKFII